MNKLREKLLSQQPLAGTHITMSDPCVSEIIGHLGFDFIWIDTEHTSIDYHTLHSLLMGAKAAGTPAIVRLPCKDPTATKKVLEMGPDGVVFPMVNTPEEADYVMKLCLYPPLGIRGFGPRRAIRYGLDDAQEYVDRASRELCRFIQIESEAAVRNLPQIVKNPHIDGYIFGPNDLSGSIGELGHIYDERTSALIDEAIGILNAAGKPFGVSTGSTEKTILKYWHDKGMRIISSGADYEHILVGARHVISHLRSIQRDG
ncbi:HpcH/HpaI aldolase family protein [Paenibacillus cymbidii]|uniref:HpcH/HpaI aldolase family protein n=1 Tax=Paenibacillus cymbidii TaxID=1639034 RepID=UPI00108120A1|nr:aldolase/citrate lyase family protein [Paenibacillus cymbidii]